MPCDVGSRGWRLGWQVYLELADLYKRENRVGEARALYSAVNELQPLAHQVRGGGWGRGHRRRSCGSCVWKKEGGGQNRKEAGGGKMGGSGCCTYRAGACGLGSRRAGASWTPTDSLQRAGMDGTVGGRRGGRGGGGAGG